MKPILFNTDMVRALLENRKTVTRRVVKPQPLNIVSDEKQRKPLAFLSDLEWVKPPYQPGDLLYVRETWSRGYDGGYIYKADDKLAELTSFQDSTKLIYRPSIHMPREAARIFLRVTNVRVERLQDITEEQAKKEGSKPLVCWNCGGLGCSDCAGSGCAEPALVEYRDVWDSTIKPADRALYGWDANPYVWCVEFEKISK